MKTYVYRDNKNKGAVIAVITAESIISADAQYIAITGNDPAKQPHVGCEIKSSGI